MNYLDYKLFHLACSQLLATKSQRVPLVDALHNLMHSLFEIVTSLDYQSLLQAGFSTVSSIPVSPTYFACEERIG